MVDLGHNTVLLEEAVTALNINDSGIYVDGTFGRGGHSKRILEELGNTGILWAIDKDPRAIESASEIQARDSRLKIYRGSFADLDVLAKQESLQGKLQGVLLDLGVSSPQIDDPQRGFSFMQDGPLDMRMDPDNGESAADWLNHAEEHEISQVLKSYGEEKFGKRIAHEIINSRKIKKITKTSELVTIIERALPVKDKFKHPATRTFQGIRIFINRELDDLEQCLSQVIDLLAVGGRLVVISFHSLEDRMVKRFMREQSRGDSYPVGLPIPDSALNKKIKLIGKAVKATADEVAINPRSRSAVMRVAEKL